MRIENEDWVFLADCIDNYTMSIMKSARNGPISTLSFITSLWRIGVALKGYKKQKLIQIKVH